MTPANHPDADLMLMNGTVVTVDKDSSVAQAVAVKDGKIMAVGTDEMMKPFLGSGTKTIDLAGKTVLPGFVESHLHPIMAGVEMLFRVNCSTPPNRNISDVLRRLAAKADDSSAGEWVIGKGFDDTGVEEKRHLTRSDLDEVSKVRPVLVHHVSGHLTYVNSYLLNLAGISESTPNPEGGKIFRDEMRRPIGILAEPPAQALVSKFAPKPSLIEMKKALMEAAKVLLKRGVTSVHDAEVGSYDIIKEVRAYEESIAEGKFPVRTYAIVKVETLPEAFTEFPFKSSLDEERLRFGAVKIIGDGSIQGLTGALSSPYENSSTKGVLVYSPEKLSALAAKLHGKGIQIAIHANGDEAIEQVIDAYERVLSRDPGNKHRHRIEHCQMARDDQLDRMAALGIPASFFNLHVYYWGDRHAKLFIGRKRAERISPLASALARGIKFGLHSDWPVTKVSPIENVHVAVNRLTKEGNLLGGDERISALDAIRAVTIDAAYLSSEENLKGSIEVGKLADMVILSENPLQVEPMKIKDIRVLTTIVGGAVFQQSD